MIKALINAKYTKAIYECPLGSNYYQLTQVKRPQAYKVRLPTHLLLERTEADRLEELGYYFILSGAERLGGPSPFHTGLKQTKHFEWYLGDDFETVKGRKKISLIIVNSNDWLRTRMEFYYFHHQDCENKNDRMAFANAIIPQLLGQ